MGSRISERITDAQRVVGLAVILLPDARLRLDACLLRRRGDTLVLEGRYPGLESVAALTTLALDPAAPVALVVTGRGVVHKTLPPDTPAAGALAALLPGTAEADFYQQRISGPESQHLALIRRATLDGLLASLHQQGRYVTHASLGPFAFAALLPYLPGDAPPAYQVGGYELTIHGVHITAAHPLPPDPGPGEGAVLSLGGELVEAALLLPYAAALAALTGTAPAELAAEPIRHDREEWRQRRLFQAGTVATLGAFLLGLLLNFGYFSYLTTQSQALASQGAVNRGALIQLERLRQSVSRQQQFLAGAGWLHPTRHSVRADELAATVPAGLQLLTLDSEPWQEQLSRQQQRPVFGTGTVRVKGQCGEAYLLNQWLQQISRLPWVESVREQNFSYDYGAHTGTFTFTIHTAADPPPQP